VEGDPVRFVDPRGLSKDGGGNSGDNPVYYEDLSISEQLAFDVNACSGSVYLYMDIDGCMRGMLLVVGTVEGARAIGYIPSLVRGGARGVRNIWSWSSRAAINTKVFLRERVAPNGASISDIINNTKGYLARLRPGGANVGGDPASLLYEGRLNAKRILELVPQGTENIFITNERLTKGVKYRYTTNGARYEIKMHGPDPHVQAHYPGTNSARGWTAQIKVGNRYLKQDGSLTSNNMQNATHIPIDF